MSIRPKIMFAITIAFLVMITSVFVASEFFVSKGIICPEGIRVLRHYYGWGLAGSISFFFLFLFCIEKFVIAPEIARQKNMEAELRTSEKMKLIGTITAGVAHDLNNVLSGIVSYPEMILMELPEDSPLRQKLARMKKSGEKASAIVKDVMTLVRRGVAVREAVNLNTVIAECVKSPEFEKLKAHHSSVRFEVLTQDDLHNIMGSPLHLSKAFANLCMNAAEAMPDGGELRIVTENRHVVQPVMGYDRIIEKGKYVVLSVSDTGIGISPDDLKRIFEPFYTKKVMGRSGTGLGTTIVWETVKDHKGHIVVRSILEKGTCFELYFPMTHREASAKPSDIPIRYYMGKEKILIVDDMEEQRYITCEMLRKLGYSVNAVKSGEAAIEYLDHHHADLLILDMVMAPGIDGLETYKRIISHHPEQKAIIATGFPENDHVKEASKLGISVIIVKPYSLRKIGKAIRAALDGARP